MANRREFREVARLVEGGRIQPVIDAEIPLEEAAHALQRMRESDRYGKIVITIGPPDAT